MTGTLESLNYSKSSVRILVPDVDNGDGIAVHPMGDRAASAWRVAILARMMMPLRSAAATAKPCRAAVTGPQQSDLIRRSPFELQLALLGG